MLAELRAIREEIRRLAERVGDAATREDLGAYCTVQRFEDHIKGHRARVEGWRAWLPIVISALSLLAGIFALLHGQTIQL